MTITTTPTIEGKSISEYKGIIASEAIMGANVVRDLFASITDIVGGRLGAYERKLIDAREISMQEMAAEAQSLDANAIVGVDLD